jgi:hypothetical protein
LTVSSASALTFFFCFFFFGFLPVDKSQPHEEQNLGFSIKELPFSKDGSLELPQFLQ